MEIWKSLKDYEDYFEISSIGNLRRIKFDDELNKKKFELPFYRKPVLDKDGYLKYKIHINGKYKTFFAHRLVALNFIENPLNKKEVNHINGIKTDNRLENLEWVTASENRQHCIKFLNPNLSNEQNKKKIAKYDLDMNFIKEYDSLTQASVENDVNISYISMVCSGKKKSAKKFIYKFI